MNGNKRNGFTLVEILIVVVIMAVLAATIIPQFSDSSKDAKISTGKFNLHTLRTQIQMYKAQHDGVLPGNELLELTRQTNVDGDLGEGPNYPYGPYVSTIPNNPFTNNNTITVITSSPATTGDVTANGGWLYNANTGEIWLDNEDYITE